VATYLTDIRQYKTDQILLATHPGGAAITHLFCTSARAQVICAQHIKQLVGEAKVRVLGSKTPVRDNFCCKRKNSCAIYVDIA